MRRPFAPPLCGSLSSSTHVGPYWTAPAGRASQGDVCQSAQSKELGTAARAHGSAGSLVLGVWSLAMS